MSSAIQTMKFNHVSFPSRDVAATAAFFERSLGCTGTSFGTSKILKRHDFDIVIEDAGGRAVDWPENFHIGFELGTAHEVETVFRAFQAGGASTPLSRRRSRWLRRIAVCRLPVIPWS
jgi:catechol 2,3-dioxygenase-like lactoylglutathione lyase family enzyme